MRKKSIHRLISLAMVVAMCITLPVGTGLTAFAQQVDSVALTINEDLLLTGSVYDTTKYTTNLNNVVTVDAPNCTVTEIKWVDVLGHELQNGDILLYNNTYNVVFSLENSVDGFDKDVKVTCGNVDAAVLNRYYDDDVVADKIIGIQCEAVVVPVTVGEISEISLSNITQPQAGDSVSDYNYTDPDGRYTATGTWFEWDAEQNGYIPSEDTFGSTDSYLLDFQVIPSRGYIITDNAELYINDSLWNNYWCSNEGLGGTFYINSPSGIAIDEIVIDEASLPVAKEGDTYSETEGIPIPVSSDQYKIVAYWMDEDENTTTGTFTKAAYQLQLVIYAQNGYYFEDEVFILTDSNAWWPYGSPKEQFYSISVSLETPIEEVVLPKVPVAELGKTLSGGEFALEVPAGAKYTATAYWMYNDKEYGWFPLEADTTVKSGMKYRLEFNLSAEQSYRFADEFYLVINGNTHKMRGGTSSFNGDLPYSFLTQISKAEVTGVIEPTIGAVPSYDSLKVAEPEKYEIGETIWYDVTAMETVPATKFEAGHEYYLSVELKAKEGYEFVPYTPYKIAGFSRTFYNSMGEDTIYIESDIYSFETVISDIRINNVPTMVIGKTANTDISLPDDAKYEARAVWYVWNEKDGVYDTFTGVFEKGKTYQLMLDVYSETGYRFDKDTTVWYQDGTQITSASIYNNTADYLIDYPQEGAKLIQKVELSIDGPKTGQHSSVPPTVKLLNGTGCHVADAGKYHNPPTWLIDDIWFDGYFVDGRNYGAEFFLIADEGYVFAEDLVIVINGISIPADAFTRSSKDAVIEYYFNMTCEHIYDNDSDSTCNICGYVRFTGVSDSEGSSNKGSKEIPDTGDTSSLGMYFVVMMISVAVMIGLMVSKKKNKIKNS